MLTWNAQAAVWSYRVPASPTPAGGWKTRRRSTRSSSGRCLVADGGVTRRFKVVACGASASLKARWAALPEGAQAFLVVLGLSQHADLRAVSYTHLRAHETPEHLV